MNSDKKELAPVGAFRTFDFSKTREDPCNLIHSTTLTKGRPSKVTSIEISPKAFYPHEVEEKHTNEKMPPADKPLKIHRLLLEWASTRPGQELVEIIINFREDLQIPRFPEPIAEEKRDSPRNQQVLEETKELIEKLKARRSHGNALFMQVSGKYEAEVLETFWLTRSILVRIPLRWVKELSERDDVLFIEPRFAGTKPPANNNPNDDVEDGRVQINSDSFFNLGLNGGYIGLLDTGVLPTHTLFVTPPRLGFLLDCAHGGPNCDLTTNGSFDPTDRVNHGTKSAGIISGNANLGPAFRGVTGVTLDSFKVYFHNGTLDTAAVPRAFQAAIAALDRVIVAEIQAESAQMDTVCSAAEKAFDAGAVIIAAVGNNGAGNVNGPALAHKVIGVGAFGVDGGLQFNNQSFGPTPDGRIKPDIQAPTQAETADAGSNTALSNHDATSGATPFAAGAAALMRNWLRGTSGSIDPGQVYAMLILSGQNPYPFQDISGAGRLRLPTDGLALWGKIDLSPGETCDIPINIGSPQPTAFDGALWWPETASQAHNDVDLCLVDPTNTVVASSQSVLSVFERARVNGPIAGGTWIFRVRGQDVTGVQTVYWAAMVH